MSGSYKVNFDTFDSVKIFILPHLFLHFLRLSPYWKGPHLLSKIIAFHSLKDVLFQVWLKLTCWFWSTRLSIFLLYTCSYYLPWRHELSFTWTVVNPPPPKMICAYICWNWTNGSEDEVENVKVSQIDDRKRTIRNIVAHLLLSTL
jgi:hypothetical protein